MSASSGRIHVLHVDDEPDFAGMAAEFIQRQDERLEVDTATSGSEGLERLSQNGYECIVSDFDMPGQTGIDFLKAVREDHADLPFILYTGKGSEEVASEAISAGVTEYLQKEGGTGQYTVLANRIGNAVEQQRAKTALAEREQRLNQFFEQSPLGVIRWDDEFKFARLNDTAKEILGYSDDELVGEPWEIVIPAEDRGEIGEIVVSDLLENKGGYHSINENVRKDGERIVCEWHNWVVTDDNDDVVAVFSQFEDITDRKERERELRETKSQLETTISEQERHLNAFDGFLDIATDSTCSFDERMRDVLALGADYVDLDMGILAEIDPPDHTVKQAVTPDGSIEAGDHFDLSETFCELVYEADGPVSFHTPAEGDVEAHPAYRDLGLESYIGEPLILDDDRFGTLNFSSPSPRPQPFTDAERAFVRTLAEWVSHELRRQEREEEIGRLNQLHQTVLSNIRETVLVTDDDGEFTYICPNVEFLFGYDDEAVAEIGTVGSLLGEQLVEADTLGAAGERTNIETTITDSSGNELDVVVTVRQVDIEGGTRLYSVRDISELKVRERELQRQNERLGEFASVVSHDLRSPLSVAKGRLELVAEECESEHLEAVAHAHDRMGTLIEDLLSLAKSGQTVGETEPVELSTIADSCWRNVETDVAQLRIETDATIQADRTRVQQLLENLLRNAVEHGGSEVTVTLGDLPDGFYVEDDGPGIPPDERDNVLEPGYSPAEDATGYGLSIVRDIAKAHGWSIEVTAGTDGGARIEITDVE